MKMECSLRSWAGGVPESTGESSLRVGLRHPEMMRNVAFNATSRFFNNYIFSFGDDPVWWSQM